MHLMEIAHVSNFHKVILRKYWLHKCGGDGDNECLITGTNTCSRLHHLITLLHIAQCIVHILFLLLADPCPETFLL